jgi:hypothetical protein
VLCTCSLEKELRGRESAVSRPLRTVNGLFVSLKLTHIHAVVALRAIPA